MDQIFPFSPTPLDAAALRPQVRRALERRTELLSRQKYPGMWALTDRLRGGRRLPKALLARRRRRRALLGFLSWALGLFLLIPGSMDPHALAIPLGAGAVCFGGGTAVLWRNRRTALGILGLAWGLVLSIGALGSPEKLGCLLPLGLAALTIGAAALLRREGARRTAFDRAAERLLQTGQAVPGEAATQALLTPAGLVLCRRGEEPAEGSALPLALALETEDLLLLFSEDRVVVLQKKDLRAGDLPALREALRAQTQ